ncbi:MAG TPA: hypothetical protein VJI32_06030 [Candidatus Nanoarchaeia archaeon]|nr:hypothetical protein [Candidatus Nanoarchaeia archaeon]
MKRVLPDTNIYGLLTVDPDLHTLHQQLEIKKGDITIIGFSIIRKELKKVPKKVIDGINIQASLLRTYALFISKEYEMENSLVGLAQNYYEAYVSLGGTDVKEDIYNDLLIVACASLKNITIVVSEDNATLANQWFQKSYAIVNKKRGIMLPRFIKYKEFKNLLRGTRFSDPFIDSSNKFGVFLSFLYIFKGILFFGFHTLFQEKLIYKDFVS